MKPHTKPTGINNIDDTRNTSEVLETTLPFVEAKRILVNATMSARIPSPELRTGPRNLLSVGGFGFASGERFEDEVEDLEEKEVK